MPLDFGNCRLSREEITAILVTWPIGEPEILLFGENYLTALLAGDHRPWLRQIADAQLRHWRLYEPPAATSPAAE